MNLKKTITSLILGMALGAAACQYTPPTPTPEEGRREYGRYFYLSGVNSPDNHISGFTYNAGAVSYTAANHQTVYLPLTVYVGAADVRGGANAGASIPTTTGSGAELENITMTLQYRILPDTTWHTAATKKFSAGDIKIMTQKKLFGSVRIDCDAEAGSVILIRLYVSVIAYKQFAGNGGSTLSTSSNLENADPTSGVVDSSSSIAGTESVSFQVASEGANLLAPGLNFASTAESGNTYVTYQDGWTPQWVMAVTVGNKRRPGK